MPWTVSRNDECPASRPWAVIKDDDGSIEGCHASEADAQAQLVALNIAESEGRAYESIDFRPPEGVAEEAQRGLDWRREYGRAAQRSASHVHETWQADATSRQRPHDA